MNRKRNLRRAKPATPKTISPVMPAKIEVRTSDGVYIIRSNSVQSMGSRKYGYVNLIKNVSREHEEETIKKLRELIERIKKETKSNFTKDEVINLIINCLGNSPEIDAVVNIK
jgi:hypothetical protein